MQTQLEDASNSSIKKILVTDPFVHSFHNLLASSLPASTSYKLISAPLFVLQYLDEPHLKVESFPTSIFILVLMNNSPPSSTSTESDVYHDALSRPISPGSSTSSLHNHVPGPQSVFRGLRRVPNIRQRQAPVFVENIALHHLEHGRWSSNSSQSSFDHRPPWWKNCLTIFQMIWQAVWSFCTWMVGMGNSLGTWLRRFWKTWKDRRVRSAEEDIPLMGPEGDGIGDEGDRKKHTRKKKAQ